MENKLAGPKFCFREVHCMHIYYYCL